MRTIWHSLAWKEWHEHKWKLASIVAIMWATATYCLMYTGHEPDALVAAGSLAMVLCSGPLALFIGLGTAASERSRDTLPFLQALPVPMWRHALCKFTFGLLTATLPVLLTLLYLYAWYFGSKLLGGSQFATQWLPQGTTSFWLRNPLFASAAIALVVATSLYVWSAAPGVNRKDEVSAGAVALTVMLVWWLMLIGLWNVLLLRSTGEDVQRLLAIGAGSAPLGLLVLLEKTPQTLAIAIVSALVSHGLLAAWYVRRFGRCDAGGYSSRSAIGDLSPAHEPLNPHSSPMIALAWKQYRESGPIALIGLVGAIGVASLVMLIDGPRQYFARPAEFANLFGAILGGFGVVIAVVLGIGACIYEVGPQLNTFWRTRPIRPDAWFWMKYGTGAAILLATIYIPWILIGAAARQMSPSVSIEPEIGIFPLMHLGLYAAAVAMTCLVRQAVYAAILSIPAAFGGVIVIAYGSTLAVRLGLLDASRAGLTSLGEVAIGLTIGLVVNTIVAWLAMRFDWGRKSRY